MARFLPRREPQAFPFVVEELEYLIGSAVCNLFTGRRPVMGYMFRREGWGRGYATEALKVVLEALERKQVEVPIEVEMDMGGREHDTAGNHDKECRSPVTERDDAGFMVESLLALTEVANVKSRKVLEKRGFVKVREFRIRMPIRQHLWIVSYRGLPTELRACLQSNVVFGYSSGREMGIFWSCRRLGKKHHRPLVQ